MDQYQEYIHKSRYARYLDEKQRRELWPESVARVFDFWTDEMEAAGKLDDQMLAALTEAQIAVLNLEVMPSMRVMMTAGEALRKNNIAAYNCAYHPIDHIRAFDELLIILLHGTGSGFSVERDYWQKLPTVADEVVESETTIVVRDSKEGWQEAFRQLVSLLYSGTVPKWDLSKVRPAGERLKTFGGRASGPGPLDDLFRFTVHTFLNAEGRKLNSLEVHDLCCKIADVVVVGGVRRSALISLSNLSDQRMRHAKDGDLSEKKHRYRSNNSVVYTEKPDVEIFMEEGLSLYRSKSGERGIFNRQAADYQVDRTGRRETGHQWGTNPCSEIILRPSQFCNLTEVVVRADDSVSDLERKVRIATFLGTLQSTLTNFKGLRKIWTKNCEEERLLGVSMTGILDHSILGDASNKSLPNFLSELKRAAVEENVVWANKIGIERSAAITCVKPSGTVSQLVNSASGIHARHAPFYLRRVTGDKNDPLTQFLVESGVPHEESRNQSNAMCFSFPIAAPEGARTEIGAIEHLELWKVYQDNWCDHKPSITVNYQDHEFMEVWTWLYNNFDQMSGVALLPRDDHIYDQPPYEDISKDVYEHLVGEMPDIDWEAFVETYDNTSGSQELACSGDVCEVVDI